HQLIVGAPVKGSWWGHADGKQIFHLLNGVRDSGEVMVCRLRSEERRVGKEGSLAMMLLELTKRREASFLVVFNRPINILCRVTLFLSMALCLLLRLFVFRLLQIGRASCRERV